MSQIQELEEKIKILKQIETLDAPDDLKQQFRDLVDKPKSSKVESLLTQGAADSGTDLKYNKPEYDEIIDNLPITAELKEKLKIVNHHFVKTSLLTGAVYKGYKRTKMYNFGAAMLTPWKYYEAGINKKWILMTVVGTMFGGYHYYPDLFRKLVLKEDFWW